MSTNITPSASQTKISKILSVKKSYLSSSEPLQSERSSEVHLLTRHSTQTDKNLLILFNHPPNYTHRVQPKYERRLLLHLVFMAVIRI